MAVLEATGVENPDAVIATEKEAGLKFTEDLANLSIAEAAHREAMAKEEPAEDLE